MPFCSTCATWTTTNRRRHLRPSGERILLIDLSGSWLIFSNPSKTPWGINAFKNYLVEDKSGEPPQSWLDHDSTYQLSQSQAPKGSLHILVDSGSGDDFYKKGQLAPEALKDAAKETGRSEEEVNVRIQDGFDHSYYFVGAACVNLC